MAQIYSDTITSGNSATWTPTLSPFGVTVKNNAASAGDALVHIESVSGTFHDTSDTYNIEPGEKQSFYATDRITSVTITANGGDVTADATVDFV